MARFHNLTIYHRSRALLRDIVSITETCKGFGDIHSQLRRAAISVTSNICEGCASCSCKQFKRYLGMARASCNEIQGQLEILCDLGVLNEDHPIHDKCDHLGRSISAFIQTLSG